MALQTSVEREFKFDVPLDFNFNQWLKRLSKFGVCRAIAVKNTVDTYYDTPKQILFQSGLGCRRRVAGHEKSIEVKLQPKKNQGSLFVRREWMIEKSSDLEKFPHRKVVDFFQNEIGLTLPEKLAMMVRLESVRDKREFIYKNTVWELSYDKTTAFPLFPDEGNHSYTFSEIELELISVEGDFENLASEIFSILTEQLALVPNDSNKLERSLEFLSINLTKLEKPLFTAEEPIGTVAPRILRYYLDKALKNESGTKIGLDCEFLHDMRVSVRKMRSALPLFSNIVPRYRFFPIARNLKWIGDFLGEVRDCDVYLMDLEGYLGNPNDTKTLEEIKNIKKEILEIRSEKRALMLLHLAQKRYLGLIATLKKWLTSPLTNRLNRSQSLVSTRLFAYRAIEKLSVSVIKSGSAILKNLASASDREIHKLRIRFKRLRYAIEFFTPVLGEEIIGLSLVLPAIQDVLGGFVDTFFALLFTKSLISRFSARKDKSLYSLFLLKEAKKEILRLKEMRREMIQQTLVDFLDSVALKTAIIAMGQVLLENENLLVKERR